MIEIYEEMESTFQHGTIIDFETIGSYDRRFHDYRHYLNIIPIMFGTISNHGLKIQYVSDEEDVSELLEEIKVQLKELPTPFYAFNKQCEQSIIYLHVGKTYKFWELNEWKFESKKKAVEKLKILNYDDPFHDNGRLIGESWNRGDMESCLKHNRACLLKEAEIWRYRYGCEFTFR